jgi:hypothetical protein
MNGINFLVPIPIHINSTTVIVQAQDPWMTFFSQVTAVIVGGIIALIANYALQMHSFNVQNKTNRMNQCIAAYIELLGDIVNHIPGTSIAEDMKVHMAKAAAFGSPRIRDELVPYFQLTVPGIIIYPEPFMEDIKFAIMNELLLPKPKSKSLWQFWK